MNTTQKNEKQDAKNCVKNIRATNNALSAVNLKDTKKIAILIVSTVGNNFIGNVERNCMQLIQRKAPSNFNLFCMGDDHEGNPFRHNSGFQQFIDMMHSEYKGCKTNLAVHHGDHIEAITTDDKRADGLTLHGNIMAQQDQAVENLLPLGKKLVTVLDANHPDKLWRFGPLTEDLCKRIGVVYGTWTAVITYYDKHGPIFNHFATHGRKTITSTADDPKRKKTNMELILKRQLKMRMGNCVLMSKGHTHKTIICEPSKELYLHGGMKKIYQGYTSSDHNDIYIHPDHRWYLNTGGFVMLYGPLGVSGYAEKAEYDPIELGFPIVMVRDREIVGVNPVIFD